MKLEKITLNLASIAMYISKLANKSTKPKRRQTLSAIANKLLETHVITTSQINAYQKTMQELNGNIDIFKVRGFTAFVKSDDKLYDIILDTGVILHACTYVPAGPTDSAKYQKGFMKVLNDKSGMKVPLREIKGVRLTEG